MNEEERIISPEDNNEDLTAEITLRPKTMDEYIGQPAMREKLGIRTHQFPEAVVSPGSQHVYCPDRSAQSLCHF